MKKLIQRNSADVFDFFDSIVPGKFLSLIFQTKFVACTGICCQIGDEFGVIPILQHDTHAIQQACCVKNIFHVELVDQYHGIIADVVECDLSFEGFEELLEQFSNRSVQLKTTVFTFFVFLR